MERPEIQERPASGRRMKTLEDRQGAKRRAVTPLTHSGLPVALARVLFSVFCSLGGYAALCSLGGYAAPPTYPQFQQSYKQRLIKLSVIGTVINAFYRIIDKVINSG